MKRLAFLLIFIFGFLLTQAQQKIRFFKENSDCVSKTYTLPVSVTCTFADGTKKRLMLERIIGDSLVFEKYYNQENHDCKFNSLKKIHMHKRGEIILYTMKWAFACNTLIFGAGSIILLSNPNNGSALIIGLFSVPTAIVSYIGTSIFSKHLPRTYKTKIWNLDEV